MLDIARYYDDAISVDSSVTSPRFKIVLCELHNPSIHGFDNNSDPEVAGHYLIHSKYDSIDSNYNSDSSDEEELEAEDDYNIYDAMHQFKMHIESNIIPFSKRTRHPFIRNYKTIISNENYIKPEIAECLYLSGDEFVAILKTFWIRIVQRSWRRVFQERKQIIARRMRIDALSHREITGKWPSSCSQLPSIHGMLFQKPKIL